MSAMLPGGSLPDFAEKEEEKKIVLPTMFSTYVRFTSPQILSLFALFVSSSPLGGRTSTTFSSLMPTLCLPLLRVAFCLSACM